MATTSLVTGGVTAQAQADGGNMNLFAALLALLGPQPGGEAPAAELPDLPGSLPEVAASAAPLIDLPGAEAATATDAGTALLKDLGAALIAASDAVADGEPVDPATEANLTEALDGVATYLETLTPPAEMAVETIAEGELALAAVLDLPADATEPTTPATSPEDSATPEAEFKEALAETLGAIAPVTDAGATPIAEAPVSDDGTEPTVQKLVKLMDELAAQLKPQAPELAAKLEVLAKDLAAGKLPAEIQALLGGEAEAADPEIDRIIDALAAVPKPPVKEPAAPPPFTAPKLQLPEMAKPETIAAPVTPAEEAPEAVTPPVARPQLTADVVRDKPGDPEPRAAAPAQANAAPPSAVAAAADAPASTQQVAPAQAATETRSVHAAYQMPVQQVNLPQVAFEVVRHFEAGNSRFQIRLDPPELGRIDVKLDVDKSGTVSARMTVERPETLDLMQRDQRALQQALQQAGLDTSKTNLEFSLRQNPFAQQGGMGEGRGQPSFAGNGGIAGSDEVSAEIATTTYRGMASAGGINLFV